MTNAKTCNVTIRSILSCAAFMKGYDEAKKGLSINYDAFTYREVWHYERGRQFAFCYDGRLKDGKRVHVDALYALGSAMNARHVL